MSKRTQVHRFRIKNVKKILYIKYLVKIEDILYKKFRFHFALTRFEALDNGYFN